MNEDLIRDLENFTSTPPDQLTLNDVIAFIKQAEYYPELDKITQLIQVYESINGYAEPIKPNTESVSPLDVLSETDNYKPYHAYNALLQEMEIEILDQFKALFFVQRVRLPIRELTAFIKLDSRIGVNEEESE